MKYSAILNRKISECLSNETYKDHKNTIFNEMHRIKTLSKYLNEYLLNHSRFINYKTKKESTYQGSIFTQNIEENRNHLLKKCQRNICPQYSACMYNFTKLLDEITHRNRKKEVENVTILSSEKYPSRSFFESDFIKFEVVTAIKLGISFKTFQVFFIELETEMVSCPYSKYNYKMMDLQIKRNEKSFMLRNLRKNIPFDEYSENKNENENEIPDFYVWLDLFHHKNIAKIIISSEKEGQYQLKINTDELYAAIVHYLHSKRKMIVNFLQENNKNIKFTPKLLDNEDEILDMRKFKKFNLSDYYQTKEDELLNLQFKTTCPCNDFIFTKDEDQMTNGIPIHIIPLKLKLSQLYNNMCKGKSNNYYGCDGKTFSNYNMNDRATIEMKVWNAAYESIKEPSYRHFYVSLESFVSTVMYDINHPININPDIYGYDKNEKIRINFAKKNEDNDNKELYNPATNIFSASVNISEKLADKIFAKVKCFNPQCNDDDDDDLNIMLLIEDVISTCYDEYAHPFVRGLGYINKVEDELLRLINNEYDDKDYDNEIDQDIKFIKERIEMIDYSTLEMSATTQHPLINYPSKLLIKNTKIDENFCKEFNEHVYSHSVHYFLHTTPRLLSSKANVAKLMHQGLTSLEEIEKINTGSLSKNEIRALINTRKLMANMYDMDVESERFEHIKYMFCALLLLDADIDVSKWPKEKKNEYRNNLIDDDDDDEMEVNEQNEDKEELISSLIAQNISERFGDDDFERYKYLASTFVKACTSYIATITNPRHFGSIKYFNDNGGNVCFAWNSLKNKKSKIPHKMCPLNDQIKFKSFSLYDNIAYRMKNLVIKDKKNDESIRIEFIPELAIVLAPILNGKEFTIIFCNEKIYDPTFDEQQIRTFKIPISRYTAIMRNLKLAKYGSSIIIGKSSNENIGIYFQFYGANEYVNKIYIEGDDDDYDDDDHYDDYDDYKYDEDEDSHTDDDDFDRHDEYTNYFNVKYKQELRKILKEELREQMRIFLKYFEKTLLSIYKVLAYQVIYDFEKIYEPFLKRKIMEENDENVKKKDGQHRI